MVSIFYVHGSNSSGKTQYCMMLAGCSPSRHGFCSMKNDGWHIFGKLTQQATVHVYFPYRTLTGDEFNALVSRPFIDISILTSISDESPINIVFVTIPRDKAQFLSLFRSLSTMTIKDMFICSAMPPWLFESLTQSGEILDPITNKIIDEEFVLSSNIEQLYIEYPTDEPGVFVTDDNGTTIQIDITAERANLMKQYIDVLQAKSKKLRKIVDTIGKRRASISNTKTKIQQLTQTSRVLDDTISKIRGVRSSMQSTITNWILMNVNVMEFSSKLNDDELVVVLPDANSMIEKLSTLSVQELKSYDELDKIRLAIKEAETSITKDQRYISRYQHQQDEYEYIQRQIKEFTEWIALE